MASNLVRSGTKWMQKKRRNVGKKSRALRVAAQRPCNHGQARPSVAVGLRCRIGSTGAGVGLRGRSKPAEPGKVAGRLKIRSFQPAAWPTGLSVGLGRSGSITDRTVPA
jgi:hypothetical protein